MTKSLKKILGLLTLTTLAGCATFFFGAESSENVAKIEKGMSQPAVINLLGRPDSVTRNPNGLDRWIYEFRTGMNKGHNLFVDFKEGALVQSGELSGRDVAAAAENSDSGTCTRWVKPEYRDSSRCSN
jgi:outer membrane protein assembly factor BamE (lipoprotein component of BamABCDE complex)